MRKIMITGMLFLSGCATAPQEALLPAPSCVTPAECDIKWAEARTFVVSHSGFKFQTYTNDFMETYSPTNASMQLGAQVNREPQPDGTWRITAKFYCDNLLGCSPPVRQTINEFVRTVAAAGIAAK